MQRTLSVLLAALAACNPCLAGPAQRFVEQPLPVANPSRDQPPAMHPERRAAGNAIISDRDPKVRIGLPKSVQYLGADRWVLYGIADCELHAFVEADRQKNVQRLYWVQFEGYLPIRPELAHQYDSPRHAQIDGLDFFMSTPGWNRMT